MSRPVKALSVRSPWWWFILHGGKDVENRDWPTRFRGTVYLHASKWWRTVEALEDMHYAGPLAERFGAPKVTMDMVRPFGGHLVGKVDIVGCIEDSPQAPVTSPWFVGEYGFVLANPVAFVTPIPCRGMLGFFTLTDDVLALAEAAEVSHG
ncbi:hypothetical protein [Azospirillum sp.]|uniref:hypothetical protein n=1 Tax=Azospirillum sp. TaxID=34012 RepID=UPI003D72A9CF